jgi:tetratricopeptide (TPR) repeat protein
MAVTLPVILLLLDHYPLRRLTFPLFKNLSPLLEKIPFFVLGIASGAITITAQQSGGAIASFDHVPLALRLLNALHTLLFYLKKMLWPFDLVPFYPFSEHILLSNPLYLIPALTVLVITASCLWMVKRGSYLLFTVWSYYVITLLPVLGILQVGSQSAADRYTYLPGISIFLMAGLGVAWGWRKASGWNNVRVFRGVLTSCLVASLLVLVYLTTKQIGIWRDSKTLWDYTIKAFPKTFPEAYANLGAYYLKEGTLDEAIEQCKKALSLNPRHARAYANLGNAYGRKGMWDEAIASCEKALAIDPSLTGTYSNLGLVYDKKGLPDKAIAAYKKAIAINPSLAEAHYNLGIVYQRKGMRDEAIAAYKKAFAINPHLAEMHKRGGPGLTQRLQ